MGDDREQMFRGDRMELGLSLFASLALVVAGSPDGFSTAHGIEDEVRFFALCVPALMCAINALLHHDRMFAYERVLAVVWAVILLTVIWSLGWQIWVWEYGRDRVLRPYYKGSSATALPYPSSSRRRST